MTVKEFLEQFSVTGVVLLRDGYNGRRLYKIGSYLDREVIGCYAELRTSKHDSSIAQSVLVLWVKHED